MDDPKGRKASRDGEHTACFHTTILDWFLCQHKKESNTEWASHDPRKSMEGNCPIKAVCITDAKDCFWSKANDFHSCSIKKLKTWTIFCTWYTKCTKFDAVLTYTLRNMYSVFLRKSRPVNLKQPLQKNCFPKNFSQRWSN